MLSKLSYRGPADFILLEATDFETFPVGGQLSLCKQIISTHGDRVAAVGYCRDPQSIGNWTRRNFNGLEIDFFGIGQVSQSRVFQFFPRRLEFFLRLIRWCFFFFINRRMKFFVQSHEVIIFFRLLRFRNVCFCFPGLENPLAISRFPWARYFSGLFDFLLIRSISYCCNLVLAAADDKSIESFLSHRGKILGKFSITKFPTRFDPEIFFPDHTNFYYFREMLQIPRDSKVIVVVGRVHWAKGWKLVVDALKILQPFGYSAVFVGSGPDETEMLQYAKSLDIAGSVAVSGFISNVVVSKYLNAGDVLLLPSVAEGWSTVLVEALACGIPIVSTNVSSASDIVKSGVNGEIVFDMKPESFANAVLRVSKLERVDVISYSNDVAKQFSTVSLFRDLHRVWSK